MVDCHELLVDGYINNEKFNPYNTVYRFPVEFLCPDTRSMLIQGHWASIEFSYVEVSFMGCDEDSLSAGKQCEDSDGQNFNLEGLQTFVDFSEADPDKVVVQERSR